MLKHFGCRCLPHLPAAAACGGSALSDPVWPKAHPGQSSPFCKELWRCPRSTRHTWQTVRGIMTYNHIILFKTKKTVNVNQTLLKIRSTDLDSAIMAEAWYSSWVWWSVLKARAYATLSRTSLPTNPYLIANRIYVSLGGK